MMCVPPFVPHLIQRRATAWRVERAAKKGTDPSVWRVLAKLMEEVGELSRAIIGEHEGRPDRGDPGDEAAQVLVVLAGLMGQFYPDRDLFGDALSELDRIGAPECWVDSFGRPL